MIIYKNINSLINYNWKKSIFVNIRMNILTLFKVSISIIMFVNMKYISTLSILLVFILEWKFRY